MIGGLNVLNYHNLIENGDRLTKMISDNGGSFPRNQKVQNAAPPVLPQGEKPARHHGTVWGSRMEARHRRIKTSP